MISAKKANRFSIRHVYNEARNSNGILNEINASALLLHTHTRCAADLNQPYPSLWQWLTFAFSVPPICRKTPYRSLWIFFCPISANSLLVEFFFSLHFQSYSVVNLALPSSAPFAEHALAAMHNYKFILFASIRLRLMRVITVVADEFYDVLIECVQLRYVVAVIWM